MLTVARRASGTMPSGPLESAINPLACPPCTVVTAMVIERVAREVELPADDGARWDDRIVTVILSMDATFARFPGVAAQVLPFRRPSPAVDMLSGAVFDCLIRAGFDDGAAHDLLGALHFVVGGWMLGQRPNLRAATMTPVLLERCVRWMLAGARSEL